MTCAIGFMGSQLPLAYGGVAPAPGPLAPQPYPGGEWWRHSGPAVVGGWTGR